MVCLRAPERTSFGAVTTLRISEVFASLQGEGASVGMPATFLRLGDCNLSCQYCDTAYSWDWRRYDRKLELFEEPVLVTAARIRQLAPRRLVITGGEPLLQQAALEPLVQELREFCVEVETNATIVPSQGLLEGVTQWNASPKLASSGMPQPQRAKPEVLAALLGTQRAWLKFVVTGTEDLDEIRQLVQSSQWPVEKVILMPEARTAAELRDRSTPIAEAAMQHGYRFSTRLHVLLWQNARGR